MTGLGALIKRNTKLYFKDKGMFFTSLITPIILLVLYGTFLKDVFEDSFRSAFSAAGITASDKLIGGCVGGQIISSLLAVCCVTVAFCSNMIMVQDKISGARRDFNISPVKKSSLALGYYISTLISTLIVCYVAAGMCFLYLAKEGWYLSFSDVLYIIFDVFLLVMFGTALSSIVNCFLSSQGQISAVGTIVSAGYGFICGAYMPMSQFSSGLQKVLSFLPGTYGTVLLRNHSLNGTFKEMKNQGLPSQMIDGLKDSVDCNFYFFDSKVTMSTMYLTVIGTVVVLVGAYIVINMLMSKKNR